MTNTSKVDGNNLVYTVPSETNYTGVSITTDANGAGQACSNIKAGASCTFTALIPAGSKPGSFTVLATPNSIVSNQTTKSTKSSSISVTANLGLVDVPNTQNQYYILPSDQTITANSNESTTVMISVVVREAAEGLNALHLVDETGAALSYIAIGTSSYTVNSVNTYLVTIPAGKSLQHIQVLSNVCSVLNIATNNNTACSNDADVNLATQGNGILTIQPTYVNMSESYNTQVITLTNTGTGDVSSITYPNWSELGSQFSVTNNNCASLNKLSAGQSCTMTLNYAATANSGQITPVFSYDDDNNGVTVPKNIGMTIPYMALIPEPEPEPVPPVVSDFSVLNISPSSISLTPQNPRRVITLTNLAGGSTAGATITNLVLPTLTAPLEFESSNCRSSLSVGDSCIYTIKYNATTTAGLLSLSFTYNNGLQQQTSNLATDWEVFAPIIANLGCMYPLPADSQANSCTQVNASLAESPTSSVTVHFSISSASSNGFYFAPSYNGTPSTTTSCTIVAGSNACSSTDLLCAGSQTIDQSESVSATASNYAESQVVITGSAAKVIFITNAAYNGDLKTAGNGVDGFDGADKICQATANAGSVTNPLGATWKAMLEDNNATKTCQFYKNANLQLMGKATGGNFVGAAQLPNINAKINWDENGSQISLSYPDNGGFSGAGGQHNCNNWTNPTGAYQGRFGSSNDISPQWWSTGNFGCNYQLNHIWCVQQ